MIQLTESAAGKVKELLVEEGRSDIALRVAVQPGGCSGLRYAMFLDDQVTEKDATEEQFGVRLVIDKMSVPYLTQATIDFVDTLEQSGFTIDNPAAQSSCACGQLLPASPTLPGPPRPGSRALGPRPDGATPQASRPAPRNPVAEFRGRDGPVRSHRAAGGATPQIAPLHGEPHQDARDAAARRRPRRQGSPGSAAQRRRVATARRPARPTPPRTSATSGWVRERLRAPRPARPSELEGARGELLALEDVEVGQRRRGTRPRGRSRCSRGATSRESVGPEGLARRGAAITAPSGR